MSKERLAIQKIVMHYTRSKYVDFSDKEDLIQSIWLELHLKKIPITYLHVKNKIIDAFRKKNKEAKVLRRYYEERSRQKLFSTQIGEIEEFVSKIINNSDLSNEEETFLYLRFYEGMTTKGIAICLSLSRSKVERSLEKIITKLGTTERRMR